MEKLGSAAQTTHRKARQCRQRRAMQGMEEHSKLAQSMVEQGMVTQGRARQSSAVQSRAV